jgi:hypothetical protein
LGIVCAAQNNFQNILQIQGKSNLNKTGFKGKFCWGSKKTKLNKSGAWGGCPAKPASQPASQPASPAVGWHFVFYCDLGWFLGFPWGVVLASLLEAGCIICQIVFQKFVFYVFNRMWCSLEGVWDVFGEALGEL